MRDREAAQAARRRLLIGAVGVVCFAAGVAGALVAPGAQGVAGASTQGPTISEFPIPAGSKSYAIAAGPDGNIWFLENSLNKVAKLDPSTGAVTDFAIPTANSSPQNIVAGPDNALWFTEFAGQNIGRIPVNATSPSDITEYPVPQPNPGLYTGNGANPDGIALGPDNALWFTDNGGGAIGRITTSGGTPTAYNTSEQPSYTSEITEGPNGAMWFQEGGSPTNVGQISTGATPAVTEYTEPNGVGPIAAGSDGAVWFLETGVNKIARMDTSGNITNEYPVPTPHAGLKSITTGPAGTLWFTEDSVNQIGCITTAGAVTEYPVPTASGVPVGITAGPNNTIWFTEFHADKIGYLTAQTGTCPAAGTTTTTTTATTTPLRPTATQVICDYFVATSTDQCLAAVGDAGAPPASTPTGTVSFSSTGSGMFLLGTSCALMASPSAPTVPSCSVDFLPGSMSNVPNITASYSGDSTHAASIGGTQFLSPVDDTAISATSGPAGQYPGEVDVSTDAPAPGSSVQACAVAPGAAAANATAAGLDLGGLITQATRDLATLTAQGNTTNPQPGTANALVNAIQQLLQQADQTSPSMQQLQQIDTLLKESDQVLQGICVPLQHLATDLGARTAATRSHHRAKRIKHAVLGSAKRHASAAGQVKLRLRLKQSTLNKIARRRNTLKILVLITAVAPSKKFAPGVPTLVVKQVTIKRSPRHRKH